MNAKLEPCPQCGLKYNCICHQAPKLVSHINIALLLHKNEVDRDTNTGKLVSNCLANTQRFIWDRVTPPQELLNIITSGQYEPILLFPSDSSIELTTDVLNQSGKPPLFIILDATWQEAKKMVRRSPWLKALTFAQLSDHQHSAYSLRRNQEHGNLCTCETAAALMRTLGEPQNAKMLDQYFYHYLVVFNADKSGHKLLN